MNWFSYPLMTMATILSAAPAMANEAEKGQEIFRSAGGYGCSTCHGLYAQGGGNAGGNIRGKGLDALNQILEKEPTMQLLGPALPSEERRLVADYVESLGKLGLVEWTIDDSNPTQAQQVIKGKETQLVVLNKTFDVLTIILPQEISASPLELNPYETKAVNWIPGEKPLQFTHKHHELDIQLISESEQETER